MIASAKSGNTGKISPIVREAFPAGRAAEPRAAADSMPFGAGTSDASRAGMSSSRAVLSVLAPSFLVAACATTMKPPAQSAGPALSDKGVQVAVLRQGCAQTQEADMADWDLVDETVEIEVRNASAEPAVVQPDHFRLLAPDGSALTTTTWRAADPLTVAGGQARSFELRFMTRGGLECTKEMRLDPDAGITLRDAAVAFHPVSFVPTRGL